MAAEPQTEAQAANSITNPATAAPSHPRGLYTLFFTEMWERFSYYGMRALLVLFLVDQMRGGFGLTDSVATAIYGIYTAAVYLAALPGGWIADRLLGARRAVWYGGIIIACGHFTIAFDQVQTFYIGLILIVLGTGLLKPNISALVAQLYPEGGARRDAGFTIFYMGINLGAALGPLICSALGEKIQWRLGFGAAGVGMVLGLVQFHFNKHHLGPEPVRNDLTPLGAIPRLLVTLIAAAALLSFALLVSGAVRINPLVLARWLRNLIAVAALAYFVVVFVFYKLTPLEKRRMGLIVILFFSATLFWAGFEQVGSSFNLFAERYTQRRIFGTEIPAGWFQTLGPIFIITLAPVMAAIWVRLARRNGNPSIPVKFGLAFLLLAAGFVAMALAAKIVVGGHKAGPVWLVLTYLLHTVGELCLSPVGLSSVTKLAPPRLVGQMMGVWFLGASLGNLLAGLIAGQFKTDAIDQMPSQFLMIALPPIIAGVILILLSRTIRRRLADL
jgi:POT family proton-dependent oligopeptide transporter